MATEAQLTWEGLRAGVAMVCKDRGWHHGVPIMSATDTSRRLILAKGCPLADEHGHDVPVEIGGGPQIHVCSVSDCNEEDDSPVVINAWVTRPTTIVACRQRGKAKIERIDTSRDRFDMYVRSLLCQAGAVDSDAELKAMIALKGRINDNQWAAYILGNAFPETSKRSGVTYIFRKGLPTIAMRCRPNPEGGEDRIFLAALCSHTLGWYEGTHVGCCPPSDDVLAHLLLMRSDEHDFWRKSNQHGLNEVQAAI